MYFGVTEQAVYGAREQHFREAAWKLERIPHSEIIRISLSEEKSFRVLILGGLVFAAGLIMTVGFAWNIYNALPGTRVPLVPWPLIFMAAGIAMPILGRGRRILAVRTRRKTYKWKVGLFEAKKNEMQTLQTRFIDACRRADLPVSESDDV
jgi:hypothetical protein